MGAAYLPFGGRTDLHGAKPVAIMRDDGTTAWGTLARWLLISTLALIAVVIVYLAGAWLIVMNTDRCPSPWTRLDDGACGSPM